MTARPEERTRATAPRRSSAGSSRSRAMWAASAGRRASGLPAPPGAPSGVGTRSVTCRPPNMRWSTRSTAAPPGASPSAGARWRRTRRWRGRVDSSRTRLGARSAVRSARRPPRVSAAPGRRVVPAPGGRPAAVPRTRTWPLMPRWADRARPSSSGSHKNLPRRTAAVTVLPVSRLAKASGPPACRRRERASRTSTALTVRPIR